MLAWLFLGAVAAVVGKTSRRRSSGLGELEPPTRQDVMDAWYRYLSEYHEGQWSRKYARLSKLSRHHRPREHLTPAAKRIYWRLCNEQP